MMDVYEKRTILYYFCEYHKYWCLFSSINYKLLKMGQLSTKHNPRLTDLVNVTNDPLDLW